MKATKQFKAVPNGEFHPVTYEPGDEIPPELEATARYYEALEEDGSGATATAGAKKEPTKKG